MLRLVQVIDQAVGYVAPTPLTTGHSPSPPHSLSSSRSSSPDPHSHSQSHPHSHASHHAAQPPSTLSVHPSLAQLYSSQTVQEKWVDNTAEYADWERQRWKEEGDWAIGKANEGARKEAGGSKDWRELKEEMGGGEAMEGVEENGLE